MNLLQKIINVRLRFFAGFLVITKLVRYTFSMNGAAAIATTFHWNENSSSKINFNDIIT